MEAAGFDPDRIRANLSAVRQRMRAACESADRDPEAVRLLLATKTQPPGAVRIAIEAGERLVAENRVQEIRPKFEALEDLEYERHFIGHLQSNKINALLPFVSCIQTLDRTSLAAKLQKKLEREGEEIDVLLQVNTSGEDSKFGVAPEAAVEFAKEVRTYDALRIRGLMTIGLLGEDPEAARPSLALLRQIRDQISELDLDGVRMDELSMGMSADLEVAIAEGSTIIRVGSAIFGAREPEN